MEGGYSLTVPAVQSHNVTQVVPTQVPTRKRSSKVATRMPERTSVPVQWRYIRGRRGALRELAEMPLDILYEIFGTLGLRDILHLSRASRELRNILITKRASFVWKRGRENVSLPDCPRDLNEMQYASLVYDRTCEYCSGVDACHIIWMSYSRACKKCIADQEKFRNYLMESELQPIIPTVTINLSQGRRNYKVVKYCCRTYDELRMVYRALEPDERNGWVEDKEAAIIHRLHTGLQYDIWVENNARYRAAVSQSLRESRFADVKARLIEDGWEKEVAFLSSRQRNPLRTHKSVWQSKALTDRIWENIKPEIMPLMEDTRTQLVEKHLRPIRRARRNILENAYYIYLVSQPLDSLDALLPPLGEVAMHPKVESVINADPGETVTSDHFQGLVKCLPQFTIEWRRSKTNELLSLVRAAGVDATEHDIHRPSIRFQCNSCHDLLDYPRVLIHRCCTAPHRPDIDSQEQEIADDLRCLPWSSSSLTFLKSFYDNAMTILEKSNINTRNTIFRADFDESSEYFDCSLCTPDSRWKKWLFTWNAAVLHFQLHDLWHCPGGSDAGLRVINQVELCLDDQLLVQAAWENIISTGAAESKPSLLCVLCRRTFDSNVMQVHITEKHGKMGMNEGSDYILHPDCRPHIQKLCRNPILIDSWRYF